jgi:hypothetical protein
MITDLERLTRREVEQYTADSYQATSYAILDDQQKLYAVAFVPDVPRIYPSRIMVMAQIIDEKVLIIEDVTDKPLVDALMVNAGIPREKIVLIYKGETTS